MKLAIALLATVISFPIAAIASGHTDGHKALPIFSGKYVMYGLRECDEKVPNTLYTGAWTFNSATVNQIEYYAEGGNINKGIEPNRPYTVGKHTLTMQDETFQMTDAIDGNGIVKSATLLEITTMNGYPCPVQVVLTR